MPAKSFTSLAGSGRGGMAADMAVRDNMATAADRSFLTGLFTLSMECRWIVFRNFMDYAACEPGNAKILP